MCNCGSAPSTHVSYTLMHWGLYLTFCVNGLYQLRAGKKDSIHTSSDGFLTEYEKSEPGLRVLVFFFFVLAFAP